MQQTYFLGGASPEGFETDFWNEQRACYGIMLKGGPGTGKSTLMKRIAEAFPDEAVSVYHCASDPDSLDAVVLEERGVYIADATAPHEAGTPLPGVTGELNDLAEGTDRVAMQAVSEPVRALYAANQAAHLQARKGFAGIAALEEQIMLTGSQALLHDRLVRFSGRLAGRILPKKTAARGIIQFRQRIAMTPCGRIAYLPQGYDLILLDDPARTAGVRLLMLLAQSAAENGQTAELTRSLTRKDRAAVMLVLPEQRLVLAVREALPQQIAAEPVSVVRLRRFYDAGLLRQQRSVMRFCEKAAAAAEEKTAALLLDALHIHDELESYYIRMLDTGRLDRKAEALIRMLRKMPRKAPAEQSE